MNQEKDILIPSSETLAELIMITELPTEISRNALKDIVQNDPRFFGNEDYSVEFDKASGKGDNYIGELYRIKIRSKNQTALLCIIVKLPPSNKARREQFFAAPCFNRESLFYDSIYPIFKKFQEKKGIVACKDGFYEIPACLKSITTEENECIFMEDLKLRGFEMFNRLQEVTLEHVKKIMEILGKFHAISFAIKVIIIATL